MHRLGVVVIGRNEGERLVRCLESVVGRVLATVYVDSGSTDGSVEAARSLGVEVVSLDLGTPFTAGRARNAGFDALLATVPDLDHVQFVDGDCELAEGWLEAAADLLEADPGVAVACGRLRERHPERSLYNRLAEIEWDTPVGEATACGGNAMVRVTAFRAVGGFDPTLASVEEPELCQRLLAAGWKIWRVDAEMGLHDAAMLHFGQWWRRTVRSGYGFLDATTRFGPGPDGSFAVHVVRARRWGIGWPALVLVATVAGRLAGGPRGAAAAGGATAMALPAQMARQAVLCRRKGRSWTTSVAYGVLTMAGKWPSLWGQHRYRRDAAAGRHARLIEYK